jgi:hypothetical protein
LVIWLVLLLILLDIVYSELSGFMASDGTEQGKFTYPSLGLGNSFAFKFEDLKGRVHRVNFGEWSRIGSSEETDVRILFFFFFFWVLFYSLHHIISVIFFVKIKH